MKWLRPKVPSVGIFRRNGKFLVQPRHKTTAGVYMGGEPVLIAPLDASSEELGKMILRSIEVGRQGVPHPDDWNTMPHPLWEAVGVSSWSSFVKGTIACEIYLEGPNFKILPMKHLGGRRGFVPATENEQRISASSSPSAIGDAVRQAIESADINS